MNLLKKYQNSYFSYFLMYNFYYLSWALFSALISVYLMNKGFKASDVSIVVSVSFLTSMITQPIIGSLNEKKNIKKVDTLLFILAMLGSIAFMLSNNLILITINYSIVLLILNGVNPVLEKIATTSPYPYGKIRIWGTIGYALGSQLAGLLYDRISPSSIFIVFVFTLLLCILGMLGTKNTITNTTATTKTKTSTLFIYKSFLYYLVICALFYGVTNMSNTFIPTMLTSKGLDVSLTSTILSLAVFCEAPLVLFSYKFMDKLANKTLLLISIGMVLVQCAIYGFNLPLPFILLITLLTKHPAGMLYIMINLKVINTIIEEQHQIIALALVATLKNLVGIVFQNIAGMILDVTTYSHLYLICLIIISIDFILVCLFKIEKGTDKKLFS